LYILHLIVHMVSHHSFYGRVGIQIIEKIKNAFCKNKKNKSKSNSDPIAGLNGTTIIVDQAHEITGNCYSEAVRHIIENSPDPKLLSMIAPSDLVADFNDYLKKLNQFKV
jgi:hypothetical protein